MLGASLDSLRAFYSRALDLLDPATALSLVSTECSRYVRRTRDGIERLVYLELCVKPAIAAGMEDALLDAISATRKVFSEISKDIDTQEAEEKALDVLWAIAVASYPRQAMISCFKSVEMLLLAARHDIRTRGYRDIGSLLSSVLPNIALLMPLEAVADKAGQRRMQTFPPYSLGFEANIPRLLPEVAKQVKPAEDDRSWVNPFHEFNEASETVVHHYREVADKVAFGGVLLEKWVVSSLITAAEVHVHLLDNPPTGGEPFLDTVDDRLQWFLHAPAFFFREQTDFPYHHAEEACGDLAVLGMALLQREWRLKSAEACGEAIRSIAHSSAKAENPTSYTRPYGFADCVVKLELLARAADALGWPAVAATFRAHGARPEGIPDEKWPEYVKAVATRTRQMERDLRGRDRGYGLRSDPVAVLRDILTQNGHNVCGQRCRPCSTSTSSPRTR